MLAQFSGLGFPDGMEGVIRLAQASPYIQVGLVTNSPCTNSSIQEVQATLIVK